MKNFLKSSLLISTTALLSLSSCSDWTQTESIDIISPSTDEQLQADYTAQLNAYKAGAHKVTFVTFDNKEQLPANQSEHLVALPDSIDFVVMKHPAAINPVIAAEMETIRKKGTRVLYDIDFRVFEAEWTQRLKEDEEHTLTEEDALAYFTTRTEEELAHCDAFGYDGITFSYTGTSLTGLTQETLPVYKARQQAFLAPVTTWREAHADHHLTFVGNPHYLVEELRGILAGCDYIALPTDMAENASALTVQALAAINGNLLPADRMVVCTMTTRRDDDKQIFGYFGTLDNKGDKVRSIFGCAQWAAQPSEGFERAGLLIRDAENDYFDPTQAYRHIREAIGIMNPTLKQ